eukprot:365096-Chlamydomonas_euryale.AAC.13
MGARRRTCSRQQRTRTLHTPARLAKQAKHGSFPPARAGARALDPKALSCVLRNRLAVRACTPGRRFCRGQQTGGRAVHAPRQQRAGACDGMCGARAGHARAGGVPPAGCVDDRWVWTAGG